MASEFKNQIQGALIKNGVTITEMARRMKMTTPTLSKRLHGASEWKYSEIRALMDVIGKDEVVSIFFSDFAS